MQAENYLQHLRPVRAETKTDLPCGKSADLLKCFIYYTLDTPTFRIRLNTTKSIPQNRSPLCARYTYALALNFMWFMLVSLCRSVKITRMPLTTIFPILSSPQNTRQARLWVSLSVPQYRGRAQSLCRLPVFENQP